MKTIDDVEILAVGTWNGTSFDRGDLDEMVTAFTELKLAGRLPVKLGHAADDTEPAQGWISALRRQGTKLLATLSQVPDELVGEIKEGRWRHVSIELLGNVTRGGKTYRWVPDGLAILGVARPAVDVLKGLHELVAAALPGLAYRERLAFAREVPDALATLRAENAALRRELISATFAQAIATGRITPAEQMNFTRRFGDDATLANATEWIQQAPRSPARLRGGAQGLHTSDLATAFTGRADKEVVRRVRDLMDQREREGRPLTFERAAKIIFERDPELTQVYLHEPGER